MAAGGGLLAACGGDGGSGGPAAGGKPRRGGRLRAAFAGSSAESASVVQATATAVDYVRARLIWDTIGEMDGSKPVWRVAKSVESNADASVWTVRVRDGITFSDGRALTAEDVLFTLRTFASQPTTQSAYLAGLDVKASRVRDKRTLELRLTSPDGFFDLALAQSMFVFPAGTKDFTKALGSGPFVLKDWSRGKSSLLKARKDYWGEGGPYLDEIELLSVAEAGARLNGLKAGQFDYAGALTLATVRAEAKNPDLKITTAPRELWGELSFSMNLSAAPFTHPEAVQAVRCAIDREAMVRTVTYGLGEVADDAMGRHQEWYDTSLPRPDHDPDKARRLMSSGGLKGAKLSVRTSDYEYGPLEGATAFVEQGRAAGLRVAVDKVPAADFYADMKALLAAPLKTSFYHPLPLPLALSTYYGPRASYPFTGPSSGTLNGLMKAMHAAVGEGKRVRAVHDVQQHLREHGGDAVFARVPTVAGVKPAVGGVKALGFFDYPCLRDAYLAA
ncbi:peptide/nickel transport system substrate-binding protein [Streptomyces sp. 2333.5]|nr:peptide/nickel transport system substrate-binding protein [Streptomyces sp. 2333.5]SEE88016.1 peptide/nickel transport system substrate-binding protein [Streptomyces sp. 2314.4]SEF05664.1 peptide/nickel transport system substrate-binding protein [Streptomyces sp. 2112.2]